MLYTLYTAAHYFLWIVNAAIIIYCILTWVAPRSAARSQTLSTPVTPRTNSEDVKSPSSSANSAAV